MKLRGLPAVVAVAVISLAAAACSSSGPKASSTGSSTTGAPSTGSSASTGAGGSGTGLVTNMGNAGEGALAALGNSSPLNGPAGSGLTRGVTSTSVTVGCVFTAVSAVGFDSGLEARFARANSSGGVAGRQIKLLPCKDDVGTTQNNLQDVQQLVNQNSAFAIFSYTQDILPGSTDFLNTNQVPYYGWGFLPGFCGNRWGFGWNGCLEGNAAPKSQVAHAAIQGSLVQPIVKASGLSPSQIRFAVQGDNSAAGKIGNGQYVSLFQALGSKVVYNQYSFPTTGSPDPTPYVQAVTAANPNIVFISTPFQDVGPVAAGLRAAGYNGLRMDFTNYVPGLLQSSPQLAQALQGEYVSSQVVPQEENTPWIQQIQHDLQAINQKPFVTLGAEMGYNQAEMFIEQLQAVGQTLNTATFDQKVNSGGFTTFANLNGGPGKLQWPAGHIFPADCAALLKVSGSSFQVVEPFSCYQSYKVF